MRRMLVPAVLAIAAASGTTPLACGDDSGVDVPDTPGPPMSGTSSGAADDGASGSATTAAGEACDACGPQQFCAAEHRAGVVDPADLDFACRDSCVPEGDESLWCRDDASCCGGVACDAVGICGGAGVTGVVDDGTSSDGSDTGADTSSGDATSGSSDRGGSESSGGSGQTSEASGTDDGGTTDATTGDAGSTTGGAGSTTGDAGSTTG